MNIIKLDKFVEILNKNEKKFTNSYLNIFQNSKIIDKNEDCIKVFINFFISEIKIIYWFSKEINNLKFRWYRKRISQKNLRYLINSYKNYISLQNNRNFRKK